MEYTTTVTAVREMVVEHAAAVAATARVRVVVVEYTAAVAAAREVVVEHTTAVTATVRVRVVVVEYTAAETAAREVVVVHTAAVAAKVRVRMEVVECTAAVTASREVAVEHTAAVAATARARVVVVEDTAAVAAARTAVEEMAAVEARVPLHCSPERGCAMHGTPATNVLKAPTAPFIACKSSAEIKNTLTTCRPCQSQRRKAGSPRRRRQVELRLQHRHGQQSELHTDQRRRCRCTISCKHRERPESIPAAPCRPHVAPHRKESRCKLVARPPQLASPHSTTRRRKRPPCSENATSHTATEPRRSGLLRHHRLKIQLLNEHRTRT